jgi:N-acetylglucosamine-6-phosphate deacetylase
MDGTEESVRTILATLARFGTTALLATTLTESREKIDRSLTAIDPFLRKTDTAPLPRLLGVHLEGPYICAAKRGAQPAQWVRPPDTKEFLHWTSLAKISQITLAPELDGATSLIAAAASLGVIVSLGHTDATCAETLDGAVAGARQVTHLYNAMRGLNHREPGTVGAALASDDLTVEIICDGVHIAPEVVKLTVRAKGLDRVVLITDAMEAAGMPDGAYTLGGARVTVANGKACLADGTLAGSVLTMNRAVMNVQRFCGIDWVAAAAMSSLNAARQLGIDSAYGRIAAGYAADLAVMQPETGDVEATFVGGKAVWAR